MEKPVKMVFFVSALSILDIKWYVWSAAPKLLVNNY